MAATVISEIVPKGPFVPEGDTPWAAVTWTAADATNGNKVVMVKGKALFLFTNTNVAAQHVTILSSRDAYGRKADITQIDIPAGATVCKIITSVGWEQTLGGNDIYVTAESVDVDIAVIQL